MLGCEISESCVCNVCSLLQRVKSKVGRKLPPSTNATKTDFKSKGLFALHPHLERNRLPVLNCSFCVFWFVSVGIGGTTIVWPGQSVAAEKDGVAVNQQKQTLKELLMQSMHYSEKVRKGTTLRLMICRCVIFLDFRPFTYLAHAFCVCCRCVVGIEGSFRPLSHRAADARHGSCREAFSSHHGL